MRVLIFNIYFHPEPTGTGLVIGELAKDLAALGHAVTVVTTVPHHGHATLLPEYRGKVLMEEEWCGVRVIRTGVPSPVRRGLMSRLANYLSYTCLGVVGGLRAQKPEVVVCVWPPVTTGIAAVVVGWWRRVPLVINVQDVFPDSIFFGRVVPRVIRWIEGRVLRKAARTTALSEGLGKEVVARGAAPERLSVIPMWTDVEGVRPGVRDNGFRARNGLHGKFVVLYSGNIGTYGGVGVALDMAQLLRDDERVQFVIVGRGHGRARLLERAEAMRLPNVRFLDTRPREELAEMLAAADISLVTMDLRLGVTSVPSKAFTIMASGRPVLAAMSPENEVARIVAEAGCGWCVPADQPGALAAVVRSVLADPSGLEDMGMRGRRYVERHHVREPLTRRHAEALEMAVRYRLGTS